MLLMVEKGITDGICRAIHRHVKVINKYMKNYDKDIKSSYIVQTLTTCMDGQCFQKLLVNGFKCVEKLSRFNEIFIENYNKHNDIGYFLEAYIDY